ncbi:MAG: hypothetical protein HYY45_01355 [Deltaproteobacteria bacterium]|nr:hypothetical protein [Deltaproteobacteria bacterium]
MFIAEPGLGVRFESFKFGKKKSLADRMKDPEFLAEAAKTNRDINPRTSVEIQAFIKRWFSTPPELVQKIKKIYFPAGF